MEKIRLILAAMCANFLRVPNQVSVIDHHPIDIHIIIDQHIDNSSGTKHLASYKEGLLASMLPCGLTCLQSRSYLHMDRHVSATFTVKTSI